MTVHSIISKNKIKKTVLGIGEFYAGFQSKICK